MADKPSTASGYETVFAETVRRGCLTLITAAHDLREYLVVVGGLVPGLLIEVLPEGALPHVGTRDLDIGLQVAILEGGFYQDLTTRLRAAGFQADEKEGRPVFQRWRLDHEGLRLTVDFLIEPTDESRKSRKQKKIINIEQDFAAIVTPGLDLAFRDCVEVSLRGRTFQGDQLTRPLSVCGPAAFVVLKALAFRNRVENKDAYDLFYVLRNYGNGPADVAARLRPLTQEAIVRTALEYLREDFAELESPGPNRVALFLNAGEDDNLRAEVVGLVSRFLNEVERPVNG